MKRIKVTETASDKRKRLESEKKLSDIRIFLSSENSDTYTVSKDLLSFSKYVRRANVFDLSLQLINAIGEVGEDGIDKIKMVTPEVSKVLTEIIKLKEELERVKQKHNDNPNESNVTKTKVLWENIKKLNDKFEIELRSLFDTVEALLNTLLLNHDIIMPYSEALELCYGYNLITKVQYNILKLLGQIRNLVIHNSSTHFMLKRISLDHLYLFKAVVLESRTVMFKVMLIRRTRLYAFGAYIKATVKLEKGDALAQNHIDLCHKLYSEMVVGDMLSGITYIKELYTKDELEKGYIKYKDSQCVILN